MMNQKKARMELRLNTQLAAHLSSRHLGHARLQAWNSASTVNRDQTAPARNISP
jgi:hypothetical protein